MAGRGFSGAGRTCVRLSTFILVGMLLGMSPVMAQEAPECHILCAPELDVEPTITFTGLFGRARFADADGTTMREAHDTEFELVLAVGLPTRLSWLEFTIEGILQPFDRDSEAELEFETNIIWLRSSRTNGWVSSHFDVVDKFSPAERPTDTRAYTHKLNFEWDTSLAVFNSLPEDRWLHGVEVEGSLDFVATGLPRSGDVIDGARFLDDAGPWSFSILLVVPAAPF